MNQDYGESRGFACHLVHYQISLVPIYVNSLEHGQRSGILQGVVPLR